MNAVNTWKNLGAWKKTLLIALLVLLLIFLGGLIHFPGGEYVGPPQR